MATPKTLPKWTESAISTNDLSTTGQFLAVKLSGDRTVVLMAADTDVPYGVLQNDPAAAQQAVVMKEGKCPVIAAETLTAGNQIRFDSNGKAAIFAPLTDTTAYGVGLCTIGAAASAVAEIEFNCTNPVLGNPVS